MSEVGSVYLHAPFCARRCFYCDFAVQVARAPDPQPWIEAMAAEVSAHLAGGIRLAATLDTVFVGGGTPTLLGPGAMAGVARALGPERLTSADLEWTAEANPESLTPDLARGWRAAGLNRLSIGVQSFDPGVLRWMGRLHGAEGARAAVTTAREAGIENISLDLIFALPESLNRDWRADLEAALALGVPHISLYGLTAEEGTPLGRRVAEGKVRMADEERYRDAYLLANEVLCAEGFEHYEVSNFARPGMQARHNRVYWDGGDYLGLGNSAHSLIGGRRFWNLRDWDAYRMEVSAGRIAVDESEEVSGDSGRMEEIWLGLRTDAGLPATSLSGQNAQVAIRRLVDTGLAGAPAAPSEIEQMGEPTGDGGDRVRLTPAGWLLLDEIAVEIDQALEADGVVSLRGGR